MDNGGAHKSSLVKNTVRESNNRLLYSVPYRPKTNAIESWFNQFKHYFNLLKNVITFIELEKGVKKIIRKIDIRKYIQKDSTRRRELKKYK